MLPVLNQLVTSTWRSSGSVKGSTVSSTGSTERAWPAITAASPRYSPGAASLGTNTVSHTGCVLLAGRFIERASSNGSGTSNGARRIWMASLARVFLASGMKPTKFHRRCSGPIAPFPSAWRSGVSSTRSFSTAAAERTASWPGSNSLRAARSLIAPAAPGCASRKTFWCGSTGQAEIGSAPAAPRTRAPMATIVKNARRMCIGVSPQYPSVLRTNWRLILRLSRKGRVGLNLPSWASSITAWPEKPISCRALPMAT